MAPVQTAEPDAIHFEVEIAIREIKTTKLLGPMQNRTPREKLREIIVAVWRREGVPQRWKGVTTKARTRRRI